MTYLDIIVWSMCDLNVIDIRKIEIEGLLFARLMITRWPTSILWTATNESGVACELIII